MTTSEPTPRTTSNPLNPSEALLNLAKSFETTDRSSEAPRGLAKAALDQMDKDEVRDSLIKLLDADLDAFEKAEQDLYDAKQLVPPEVMTVENLNVIIGNFKTTLNSETASAQKIAATEAMLLQITDARNRLEMGEDSQLDYDAIFDHYNNLVRYTGPADKGTAIQTEIEYARKDLLMATEQLNNDAAAYIYLHTLLTRNPKQLHLA